jgi:hypothetical protein
MSRIGCENHETIMSVMEVPEFSVLLGKRMMGSREWLDRGCCTLSRRT